MLLYKKYLLVAAGFIFSFNCLSQGEKKPLIIGLSYHLKNNQVPYLVVVTKTKEEKKFLPVADMDVNVYLNAETDSMLLGKVKTDAGGNAYVAISAGFKPVWDTSSRFSFIATSAGNRIYEASNTQIDITKARIFLDTVAGAETKTLMAAIRAGNQGLPAKDVEVKIIISRMAGNLSVGDAETYTTDSTGTTSAEFKKDSIPGDKEGYITLIAKTEDNDTYGNILIEKRIKWGAPFVAANKFDKRSLFATRNKSPLWLLALAYSIALGVWGTIIYLVARIIKIRKLGLAADAMPVKST
jgi:hypothetical protein